MNDALARMLERKISQRPLFADVGIQRIDLQASDGIVNCRRTLGLVPVVGRRVVVGRGDDGTDPPRLAACQLEPFESLRAGDFVHQMPVDVDQGRAVGLFVHHVALPQLVVKGLRHKSENHPKEICVSIIARGKNPVIIA